ncbi:MAG: hypothetical protein HZB56_13210 [Deltaproteobacteria bacterium]|nr:hypothetical protein [Deltaproteobacteria bacterium]
MSPSFRAALALAAALAWSPPAAGQGIPIDVDVRVRPQPSPAGVLTIRRIEIAFPNGRGEITVPLGATLAARAVVDCVGNGPLLGRWVVDGRPIQEVNQTVTFGASLALETAAVPGLPTFEPGLHEVTLQLTTPAVGFAIPVARYVVESASGPGRGAITQVEPADGAEVAASSRASVSGAPPGIVFTWSQASLPAPRYLLEVFDGAGQLVASAVVDQAQSYLMPPAALAALPVGGRYTWRVRGLDLQGQELAARGGFAFRLVSPAAIQLVTPAEGESLRLPYRFTWTHAQGPTSSVAVSIGATPPSQGYELRIYRNDASLRADLQALQSASQASPGQVSIVTPGGAERNVPPGAAPQADPWAPIFRATTSGRSLDVTAVDLSAAGPGSALRWAVLFRDGTGRVVAVSDAGGFVLAPQLRTVDGLPAVLDMAGQEIAVQAYAPGASLASLAGNGATRFRKDRSRRDIPLPFQELVAATPYMERRRVVAGSGYEATVTIALTLRAAVASGRIAERFAQPLALDLAGYPARLSSLTLQEGQSAPSGAAAALGARGGVGGGLPGVDTLATAASRSAPTGPGAWADLAIDLPAHAQAPAGGTATASLPGTRLATGGDFYRELPGAEAPPLEVAVSAAGPLRYQRTGTLVADFAAERDWVGAAGSYAADGQVFLADGLAEIPASALFPVLAPASIRLTSGLTALFPGAFRASFSVLESDDISPLVPAGYAVVFTGGKLAVVNGALEGASLRLDGRVALPEKVHRVPAGRAVAPFQGLALAAGWLTAAVDAGDLQWEIEAGIRASGGPGAAAMMAKAQLAPTESAGGGTAEPGTPPATTPPATGGGASGAGGIKRGVGDPLDFTGAAGSGAAPTATTTPPTTTIRGGATDATGLGGGMIRDPGLPTVAGVEGGTVETLAGAEGKPFVLRSAQGAIALPFANASPDPSLAGLALSAGWLESPFVFDRDRGVGSSPGDAVSLRVRAAGVRGTIASIDLPSAVVPRSVVLGDFFGRLVGFRVELEDGAVTRSSVDGTLLVPKPADLALPFTSATVSSTGEIVGPRIAKPATLPLSSWRVVAVPNALELSRSWLRLLGGELRFPVDPANGGDELGPVLLQQLDLGADGQVRAVTTGTQATFLGIPLALDSESAVSFAAGGALAPGPAQPLVTLAGLLSFPVLNRAMRVAVDHTPSGAAVRFADARFEMGADNADSIFARGEMSFVNGYPKGRSWKEFLGLAEVRALGSTFDIVGLAEFGRDSQGLFQRFGVGLGADGDKAASLYHGGAVSVGVKLGTAVTSFVTNGNPHAEEVTTLVGDVAALAAGGFQSQADMDRAMFKAIGDAVRVARLIHLDVGGRVGDGVETGLSIAAAGLSLAQDLAGKTHKNLSPQQTAVLVLSALDLGFPILEKSDFARGKPETLAVLAFVRLGARATRLYIDDGRLSDKDWFALGKQLFQSARPLSEDATYRVAMDVMTAVFTAAEGAQASDPALPARIGSAILGAVRQSGALRGPDWKNVLVIAQAALDGAVAAKDLPWPDSALALSKAVLDAAAGPETDYANDPVRRAKEADDTNRRVKAVLKLASRTLDAIAVTGAGIPYEKAAATVKDAYDTAAVAAGATAAPRFGVQETVQRLVDLWDRLKVRPLVDTLTDMRQILCETGGDLDCANLASFGSQAGASLRDAGQAQTPESFLAAMDRLASLAEWASGAGTPAGGSESYLARLRSLVDPVAAALKSQAAEVVSRHIVPGLTGAATAEQAARLHRLAYALRLAASDLRRLLGGSNADLDWETTVGTPVEAALSSQVIAPLARQTLASLAATSAPGAVADLWTAWSAVDPGPLDPASPPVRDAFQAKAAAIVEDCARRMRDQLYGAMHVMQECDDALLGLPGDRRAALMAAAALLPASLPPVEGNAALDAHWLESVFRSSATALGDQPPVDPVALGLERLSREIRAGALDGTQWSGLLDGVRVRARAGDIGEGTVYGYELARRLAQQGSLAVDSGWLAEMLALLRPRADAAAAAALGRLDIAATTPSDAVLAAASYWLHTSAMGQSAAGMAASVRGWLATAKTAACARRPTMAAWLTGILPFAPTQAADIRKALEELPKGCTAASYDRGKEIAAIIKSGNEVRGEMERLAALPMSEADKKERIAWFVAARVESLTAGFAGEVPGEKVLRAVHTQAKLVNQFRLRPRAERIAAVGEIVVAAMGDAFPQSGGAAPVVKAVFRGLNKFVEAGGERLPPGQKALELVSAIALEATPSPFGKTLVGGWLGLLKSHTAATITLTAIPLAVAGGVGLALHDKVRTTGGRLDLPATLVALKIEPDDFWIAMGKAVPVLTEVVESAVKLHGLIEAVQKARGTPAQALAALDKLVTEAPKLAQVGPWLAALLKPETHLLAPDSDQGVYVPNAVLALLGAARGEIPGSASVGFLDACPAAGAAVGRAVRDAANAAAGAVRSAAEAAADRVRAAAAGVLGSGAAAGAGSSPPGTSPPPASPPTSATPGPPQGLLCAVDLGRTLVQGGMSAFFGGPPSPYQLLDQNARDRLEELRRDSVFARAGADEDLSGLSGQLEVRPGATAPQWTLDVLATFQAKPVIDTAARLTLSSQAHLRLELASADARGDTRTADALGKLGYQFPPGASRLFGTAELGSPLRYLLVDFDGRAGCFTGGIGLALRSPLGEIGVNETGLDVCWKPGWFALRSSMSTPVPGLSLARIRSTIGLCAGTRGSFSGFGLDLGVGGSLDIPIQATDYGFYAGLDLGLGFSAGASGALIAGHLDSQVGLYKTGLLEEECIGHPLVDVLIWRGFQGGGWERIGRTSICRSGLGFSLDVLANLATQGGYVKARGGFDVAGLWVGGWLYSDRAGLQGGAGDFPGSLGGFAGPSMRQGASVCSGAPWPAGGGP